MQARTITALATAAVVAAVPGAAQAVELHAGPTGFAAKAPGTLVGLTSQSPCDDAAPTCGVVNVTPHPNGRAIKRLVIGYQADCEVPGMTMEGIAAVQNAKLSRAGAGGSFKASRQFEAEVGDGYTAVIQDRTTGKLDKRRRSARGSYSVVAVVMHDGQQVDRCASGTITWKAQRVR